MEALKKLAKKEKPYNGFTNLAVGYHEIVNFRTTKNNFAKKGEPPKTIVAELEEEILFLPSYFWNKVDEKDLDELNNLIQTGKKVYLHFGGKLKK